MDSKQTEYIEKIFSDVIGRYDTWSLVEYTSESLKEALEQHKFDCKLLLFDVFESDEYVDDITDSLDKAGIDTDIIYITESKNKVMKCYQDHAYAYILKPLHDSDMKREISRYFKECNIKQRCLRITFGGVENYIPIDSIRYVESDHRKVTLYTQDEEYEYYSRLDDLEEELAGGHFMRCHQSYLVSVPYITDFSNNEIKIGDRSIPVSRKYKMRVQSALYQAELAGASESDAFVHGGIHKIAQAKGALICVKGEYIGKIVRLVPEKTVMVGRSGDTADVVVNLPMVSRQHCRITYHECEDYYEVCDCSVNGTFVNNHELLRRGDTYAVKPGTNIVFGDDRYMYRLG